MVFHLIGSVENFMLFFFFFSLVWVVAPALSTAYFILCHQLINAVTQVTLLFSKDRQAYVGLSCRPSNLQLV